MNMQICISISCANRPVRVETKKWPNPDYILVNNDNFAQIPTFIWPLVVMKPKFCSSYVANVQLPISVFCQD